MLEREEHERRLAVRRFNAADTRPPPALPDWERFAFQFNGVHSRLVDETLLYDSP
jgi:hypothetical protein